MESYFCRPRVIHGLFLNFNFCLEIFFRGACKSKIELNLVRNISKIFNFVDGGLEKMSGAIKNQEERWSDIVTVRLPHILFGVITFQKILSV